MYFHGRDDEGRLLNPAEVTEKFSNLSLGNGSLFLPRGRRQKAQVEAKSQAVVSHVGIIFPNQQAPWEDVYASQGVSF